MVIVLFNTALCRPAFSTVSFRKLVFLSLCAFFESRQLNMRHHVNNKEKCGTVKKIKSVKNFIIKKSAAKVFKVYLSIVYDSFFWNLALALVLVLHCYCGDA